MLAFFLPFALAAAGGLPLPLAAALAGGLPLPFLGAVLAGVRLKLARFFAGGAAGLLL